MGLSAKQENGDRIPETGDHSLLAACDYFPVLTTHYSRLNFKSLPANGRDKRSGKMNAVFS